MIKIILATSSPYRKEAFGFLGLPFVAEGSSVNEQFDGRPESPEDLVLHLAKLKAESVSKKHSEGIVIGLDTICSFQNRILEKPVSRNEAFERLRLLSGNTHQFYTGIYMINIETGKIVFRVVKTDVDMRKLTDSEIEKYLGEDSKFNTYAPGYDPLGHYSSTFVERIIGSYNNVLRGIPLEAIAEMLPELGYKI